MAPPFDNERALNEDFAGYELAAAPIQDEEPEVSEEIDTADEAEEETEKETPDPSLGSVQQYLHDIGSVALLSREREIELAKEVESATQEIFAALFAAPLALRRVIELGQAVEDGEIELRDAVEKAEDDEGQDNFDPKHFQKQISKLSRLAEHRDQIARELKKARVSQPRRLLLSRHQDANLERIYGAIKELRLAPDQLEKLIRQLTALTDRIVRLEQEASAHPRGARKARALDEIQSIEQAAGVPAEALKAQVRRIQEGEARVKAA
ncbi:MAG TPA: sigma-70 factor domain-containing protein, partial [Candidatus Limnocylindria bacterium]|nr:sigma-70 factor domain-containing protein [Candidatus Limnocylindria bacterium]